MAKDLQKWIKDLYAAYNSHDIEKFLSFHTDDVYFEHVVEDGPVGHNKEEFMAVVKPTFAAFPDFKCELTSFFASGNKTCELCVMSGTHRGAFQGIAPTGKSIAFRGVIVRELKRGKTSRVSLYYDPALMTRQLTS